MAQTVDVIVGVHIVAGRREPLAELLLRLIIDTH